MSLTLRTILYLISKQCLKICPLKALPGADLLKELFGIQFINKEDDFINWDFFRPATALRIAGILTAFLSDKTKDARRSENNIVVELVGALEERLRPVRPAVVCRCLFLLYVLVAAALPGRQLLFLAHQTLWGPHEQNSIYNRVDDEFFSKLAARLFINTYSNVCALKDRVVTKRAISPKWELVECCFEWTGKNQLRTIFLD